MHATILFVASSFISLFLQFFANCLFNSRFLNSNTQSVQRNARTMFTLITTRAQVTKSHHPLLHLNYLVTPSQFCVYNQKRRLQRYRKAAIFIRSLRFLEVRRLKKIEGSNGSFRCFWRNKESDGDAELEAEIMEFMEKSEKPSMFPTKEELLKAGRMDLMEAIKKKGGWYSLGWEGENVDEDVDFKIEEFQSRVESCSESSSLGEIDVNSQLPSSSSGISLEIGTEEDAGIEGILSRLEKQRNADFGINLGNYESGTFASSKDERESRYFGTSVDVERQKNTKDIADPGKHIRLTSELAHKGILDNPGGMISPTNEPETWRTWSNRQAGFRDTQFEAADISLSENQVERNKEASINERIIAAEEYAEALDCHEGSNQNQVQTRLKNMELELTTALQFLRSKKEGYIAKEVAGSSSSDLQKVSDAWEFRENELNNSQEKLRSIRAQLAVLEGKMALAIIDAQKMLEEKQKRIDIARKALQLLRTVCIVWPKSASEVLLAGSFDGWTTQRNMEKSKTGIFSVYLKLYPGRYEMKFIVDGVWKVDPLRPITHNGRYENNLLIIT